MITFLKKAYTFLIFFFLYAPIVTMMIFSFNESKSRGNWEGFTLKWYIDLLHDSQIASALYYTLAVAVLSALIATIIGTMAALGIHSMKGISKVVTLNISYLPMLSPDIVMGISLMLLFIFCNIPQGFLTLLLAHVTFNLPYVVFSVLPKLNQLSPDVYNAALDLGATPFTAFRKITLPQIMPGVFTGLLLSFTMSIDDFVVSFFTTGSGVSTLGITIYSMARRGINPEINALLSIMFVSIMLLLLIVNYRTSNDSVKKEEHN